MENTNEQFNQQVENFSTNNQFTPSAIPFHTHSGTDSPLVTNVSLPAGTPVKLGLGGILSTSNASVVAPGSASEQIQTSIVAGKDQAGSVGITTDNLQLNLLHQPQNALNQSFINAFRPPLYGTIPNTTISVASGGNTLTTVGYGFATNALAGANINIFNSSGALVETQTILSNTATVITITGTWGATTNGGSFLIYQPVFLGSADVPWQRIYTSEGTGAGVRFGVGPTAGGQNGLLYTDSSGNLNYRNYAGSVSALGSGGGVNAMSYGTGVTTIPTGSDTKLTLNTNSFANGITWDSTNSRLTILTAGQYIVTAQVGYAGGSGDAAGKLHQVMIFKNGSEVTRFNTWSAVGNSTLSLISNIIVNCAVSDYLEIYTAQYTGGNRTVANSLQTCYLSIAKV